MHIYFSGIGGVGLGPLAEIALDAGYKVSGSDLQERPMTNKLRDRGVAVNIGQTREHIAQVHAKDPIDWIVYTSALPKEHVELEFAQEHGIRTTLRDQLLVEIIRQKDLTLIAITGTHGKTTTTGILVWLLQQLAIPVSYSIGTTISFGPSGKYVPGSKYFVYECDEFDRNFLSFHPEVSVITALGYDHPDIYGSVANYYEAFRQFIRQSRHTIMWQKDAKKLGPAQHTDILSSETEPYEDLPLTGEHNRRNGWLACAAIRRALEKPPTQSQLNKALEKFPGTHRRFEKLADNLYTDYGHHPSEIRATLQMAKEKSPRVALVYQPHHNVRQHEVKDLYRDSMEGADKIYWVPTYLTREDPALPILTPQELTKTLTNQHVATVSDLDDTLWQNIQNERARGTLVLCMGAGSIDDWVRLRLHEMAR